MASGTTSLPVRSTFGQTMRTDNWWVQPVVVALGVQPTLILYTMAYTDG